MAIRSRRIGMGMRDEEPGERNSAPRTKISAQSFSAGSKAWEGRVGADRSSPNSFGSNFTSMRDMWAGRFLNSSGSLRDRWDRNGNINDGAERQASFDSRTGAKPAVAAASAATTTPIAGAQQPAAATTSKLKGDDYMGAPGTKKLAGDTYATIATEAASKGAGNTKFNATGGTSNAALIRTGKPMLFGERAVVVPFGGRGGYEAGALTNAAGASALLDVPTLPKLREGERYYVPGSSGVVDRQGDAPMFGPPEPQRQARPSGVGPVGGAVDAMFPDTNMDSAVKASKSAFKVARAEFNAFRGSDKFFKGFKDVTYNIGKGAFFTGGGAPLPYSGDRYKGVVADAAQYDERGKLRSK